LIVWSGNLKKKIKWIFGIIFVVVALLYLTVPSDEDYARWLETEHHIEKRESYETMLPYSKDSSELFNAFTVKRRFGAFTTRKKTFRYLEDQFSTETFRDLSEDRDLIFRTLEIGKRIIPMDKENVLWKFLTQ